MAASGKDAPTVYRNREGRRIDREEWVELQQKKKKKRAADYPEQDLPNLKRSEGQKLQTTLVLMCATGAQMCSVKWLLYVCAVRGVVVVVGAAMNFILRC